MPSDLPSTLRDGRYAVIGVLAEGSQGSTLDAVDKLHGRPVAIKRFQVKGARSWKDVELAEREARVLARLSHPQLPAHIEHFEQDGALYLVMEKIEGESLAALREREGPFSRRRIVRFLHDVAQILAYLHGRDPQVIHRDIKPANVIRRPDGSFALVDFGSVRDRLKPKGGSTVVGTFGYMAPEQFQGRALPASDLYAVGATALSLLTGQEPEELPHKGLGIDVGAALAGRNDPALESVLRALLEPDPDRRASSLEPLLGRIAQERAAAAPSARPRHFETAPTEPAGGTARARDRGRARASRAAGGAGPSAPSPPPAPLGPAGRRSGNRWLVPPILAIGLVVLLTVLRIGVAIGMRVLLPVVLTLLSLFFGRSLVRASREVRAAGRRAGATLRDAQGRVRGRARGRGAAPPVEAEPDEPSPAEPVPPARQRFEPPAEVPGGRSAAAAAGADERAEIAQAIHEVEQAVREADQEVRQRPR